MKTFLVATYLAALTQVALVGVKLAGYVGWSWWWIATPVIAWSCYAVLAGVAAAAFAVGLAVGVVVGSRGRDGGIT